MSSSANFRFHRKYDRKFSRDVENITLKVSSLKVRSRSNPSKILKTNKSFYARQAPTPHFSTIMHWSKPFGSTERRACRGNLITEQTQGENPKPIIATDWDTSIKWKRIMLDWFSPCFNSPIWCETIRQDLRVSDSVYTISQAPKQTQSNAKEDCMYCASINLKEKQIRDWN
jgi:hypothetical protein